MFIYIALILTQTSSDRYNVMLREWLRQIFQQVHEGSLSENEYKRTDEPPVKGASFGVSSGLVQSPSNALVVTHVPDLSCLSLLME